MNNFNERGAKKWTSLMLPEHKAMLQEIYHEQYYVKKPLLDEQQQERIQYMISSAMQTGETLQFHTYKERRIHCFYGTIKKVDRYQMRIIVSTEDKEEVRLDMQSIVDIQYGEG
ncbi:hypothetical protein AM501_09015 [Aneurinibacillus migulanus]|uniref:YolD-like family protein n=2 Tax=Aneurinibacillus migulanus TaxID=47500 RepID=UPI0006B47EAD|nr:YolD-like family protein [Aneurinibacillus migulanus]KPD08609.1 hypothetical protein AM501_09015 [Aneurinibacillus migulanus]